MYRFLLIVPLLLTGCGKKYVVRDLVTYQVETLAALERQLGASAALKEAAREARQRGDWDACAEYAAPALLIDAAAQVQAHRALWLAGLQYPSDQDSEEQPDPGPAPEPAEVTEICGVSQ